MNTINKKKIIFFTRYNTNSASVRYRFLQYFKLLEKNNFETSLFYLFNDKFFNNKIIKNKLNFFIVIISYIKRIFQILTIDKNSIVVIHLELFPYLPSFGEKILKYRNIKTIIDLDDAIFFKYENLKNIFLKFFLKEKFKKIFKLNNIIFSGNEYNKQYSKRYGSENVYILPTVVPVINYQAKSSIKKLNNFTIVWIGSPSTAIYLKNIYKSLYILNHNHKIHIRIIGAGEISLPGVQFESYRWSESTEINLISECHVGIMPLINDSWSKGKCGFKLIQYMACKLPCIASPVGMNNQIIQHNKNGFLVKSDDEWIKYILELKNNENLYNKFAKKSYVDVLEKFSYEFWHKQYIKNLEIISNQ